MNTVRWGMIGCGSVTELKSGPAFYKLPGSALVAVMGRREAAVRDYAARHGIARFYTDAQALIDDPEVDAVYIATPPDSHLEYSLMVAAAGKHCCVEKPMALNAEQSALMQRTFERAGLHLFVSYYRRSLPRFQQVRDWLRDGRIGELRHVTWSLCKPPAPADACAENWRTDPAIAGGGYFADLASHGFDLFQYLAGDIVEVTGFTARQVGQYAAEDAVTACWTFSSGALGMGCWNFVADRREDRVELIGSTGRITFAVFEDEPLRLEGEVNEVLAVPCHEHIQWHHVQAMNAHIRGDAEHPSVAIEALKTDRILDKVLLRNPRRPD